MEVCVVFVDIEVCMAADNLFSCVETVLVWLMRTGFGNSTNEMAGTDVSFSSTDGLTSCEEMKLIRLVHSVFEDPLTCPEVAVETSDNMVSCEVAPVLLTSFVFGECRKLCLGLGEWADAPWNGRLLNCSLIRGG